MAESVLFRRLVFKFHLSQNHLEGFLNHGLLTLSLEFLIGKVEVVSDYAHFQLFNDVDTTSPGAIIWEFLV